jgi:hypothetical protein
VLNSSWGLSRLVVGRWRGASRTNWLLVRRGVMVLLYVGLALWNVDVDIFAARKSLYLDTTLPLLCRET